MSNNVSATMCPRLPPPLVMTQGSSNDHFNLKITRNAIEVYFSYLSKGTKRKRDPLYSNNYSYLLSRLYGPVLRIFSINAHLSFDDDHIP